MGPQYIFTLKIKNTSVDIILFVDPKKTFYAQAHSHSGYEFHYIREGEASLQFGSEAHILKPGSCYIVAKDSFHRIGMVTDSIVRIGALITLHEGKDAAYEKTFDALPPFTEIRPNQKLNMLLDLLCDYLITKKTSSTFDEYVRSAFCLIFIELANSLAPEAKRADETNRIDDYVPHLSDEAKKDRILSFFHNNLATATLDKLSEELHLSKRQVARFLNDKMNDSFSGLLKKYRIEHAKVLIISGSHTLEEIAFLSGYNSYKGFYLAFQNYTGMNPKEFKESVLKKE